MLKIIQNFDLIPLFLLTIVQVYGTLYNKKIGVYHMFTGMQKMYGNAE